MSSPEFIDNLDGNTLAAAVARVMREGISSGTLGEVADPPGRIDIATAFFSPSGFARIANELSQVERIRLMIGAEPPSEARPPLRRIDETPAQFERRLLQVGLTDLDDGLRAERNQFPFTRSGRAALAKLIAVLKSGRMETKRYERAFMHAKAYIFAPRIEAFGGGAGVIAGSSNLTKAGVTTNLELNLARWDDPVVGQAQAWYERLWDEAVPFDLVELLEEVLAPFSPFEIFLRTLWQLYGGEVSALDIEDQGLPLTSFQKHGAARALRLIEETGGAIVADEVGLGKTFIAGEIFDLYVKRRQRCLLVCPAQLRDTTWKKFLSKYQLGIECVSYEQLALDPRLMTPTEGPAPPHTLLNPLQEYQLVVIDEAHNYRNPDTATRAAVLRRLLFGERRDVLMLTATPVNNSLWDLFHLIHYYQRQDAFLAGKGILSMRERFERAAKEDPASLSPDVLYPVIDATTVKRTRQFVKKHYSGDLIRLPDGTETTIVFPEPRAITVRYELPDPMPALFDRLEGALDPDGGPDAIRFARYVPTSYLREEAGGDLYDDDDALMAATVGLLRSGLLKRFESSVHAFRRTLNKLLGEHRRFLIALDKGHVVNTRFLQELSGADDELLDELLDEHEGVSPAGDYDVPVLRAAVAGDLAKLEALCAAVEEITPAKDPKLAAIVEALSNIAAEAQAEAVSDEDERQKRKVIVFSFYADTVKYLREELAKEIDRNPTLAVFRGRVVAVAGSLNVEPEEVGRQHAVSGFAPISTESTDPSDRFDLLISTDVLAEGVNLQQARNIINYDVPWNPMRLVQRHGRIDRIGSPHTRVFLRTIFPAERLDQLLGLEQRILQKIALAAASVGVSSPVQGGAAGSQVFTETREEIEHLMKEDPSLFERGGAAGAGQTGEEYRQTLRKALARDPGRITKMPFGAGSGMVKGERRGVFFCAAVGERTYLRFVPTEPDWRPREGAPIISEIGTCLRLIECEEASPRDLPKPLDDAVFDLWPVARQDIHAAWMRETDPANLQPQVRPLNRRVAEFIRAHRPADDDGAKVNQALDILEAPWPRREELILRDLFADEAQAGVEKSRRIVSCILDTGLEPFTQPPLLPPIEAEDIQLVCWMGLSPEAEGAAGRA